MMPISPVLITSQQNGMVVCVWAEVRCLLRNLTPYRDRWLQLSSTLFPTEKSPMMRSAREGRHSEAGALAKDMGLWSHEWARSLVNWAAHIERGHDSLTWSKDLLEWHGPEWIDWQRLLWSSPGRSTTNTPCCAGAPGKRWLDGLQSAKGLLRIY